MNSMHNKLFSALGLAILVAALVAGSALATIISVTGPNTHYDIAYLDHVVEPTVGGTTSTWYYAITANGDEHSGLSHLVIGLNSSCGYVLVSPEPGTDYTTPTNTVPWCTDSSYGFTCIASTYNVEYGEDPTTGTYGVKFQDPLNMLAPDNPGTNIFILEYFRAGQTYAANVSFGLKAGGQTDLIQLLGPSCSPTAVELTGFTGKSAPSAWMLLSIPMAAGVGIVLIRRRKA